MAAEISFSGDSESVDEAILVEWLVEEGEHVEKGQIIAIIETYKAVIEIEAPVSCIIEDIRVKEGETFKVPAVLCVIGNSEEVVLLTGEESAQNQEEKGQKELHKTVSPAARRYAQELGIPLGEIMQKFPDKRIKKKDIDEFTRNHAWFQKSETPSAGKVSNEFLFLLRDDKEAQKSFFALPSDLKIFILRSAGASIGNNVTIGSGSILLAERIVIENNVKIGRDCRFEAVELEIGKMSFFEERVEWRCRKIRVGDMFYCASEVRVGWGGEWNPQAELLIGEGCFIGEQAMLNPSRKITIEDEVAVGAGSKLYTHQYWQSVLEGYNASHAPIKICRNVQLGANVVILPGVTIGSDVTVATNSTVTSDVKPYRLVGGIPAVTMSKGIYPRKLSDIEKIYKVKNLVKEFIEEQGFKCAIDTKSTEPFEWEGKRTKIYFLPSVTQEHIRKASGFRTLIVSTASVEEGSIFGQKITIFNLDQKRIMGIEDSVSDLLREFFRKRGIKFSPKYWRYKYKAGATL